MAAATVLLRRSSAHLMTGSQFYCRYLSTAAKRSRLFVPTVMSSVRQFSSSPAVNNIQTPTCDVKHANNINQQPVNNDQLVREILSQLGSLRAEIESLRKANEELKEAESPQEEEEKKEEVVVVKEKHPLLKEIESAISEAEFSSRDDLLPNGFEVLCDKPGVAKVTLKKSYKKEIIYIEVLNPSYDDQYKYSPFEMKLIVTVSFARIFSSTFAEFHCTASEGKLVIDQIRYPSDGPHCEGVIFRQLPVSLQHEFYVYLQIRGVYADTPDMLHNYMVDKMNRENMRGLGKFKKLVEDA